MKKIKYKGIKHYHEENKITLKLTNMELEMGVKGGIISFPSWILFKNKKRRGHVPYSTLLASSLASSHTFFTNYSF